MSDDNGEWSTGGNAGSDELNLVGDSVEVDQREQGRQLVVLAAALVLAMSPWFTTAAVLGQLRVDWDLSSRGAGWLTIAVQLGFVIGAVLLSATNLADIVAPRRLLLFGSLGAALSTAVLVLLDSAGPAIGARLATGAFLAGVYPPALKAMSGWYQTGRGLALGVMVGALTVGSAMPHLINGIGGLGWRATTLIASGLTVVGGVIAERFGRDGPFSVGAAVFDVSQIGRIVGDRGFQLASLGYFGHMWELYAMWAWIAAFYGDVFSSDRAASFAAFAVIAVGAVGAAYAGVVSDRIGRPQAAGLAMKWSASVALVIGFLVDTPAPLVLGAGLVWGFWVVADSAQFSTIVSEVVDRRYVGTALTLQLAAGFVLSVFTIFLVPVVRDNHGWGWAFLLLAPGPMVGVWAMRALRVTDHPPQLGQSRNTDDRN